ncbi:type VII secretion protein EccB [Nocardioides zeae]|uniref:Type VII secretion protein EccB n=1 Tax=Nocardioides imazamoxiresistens TaxID=3231893 RepID=A0ABU3PW42_9ACTN|nr:type VII secretion protein EccB [Nocardioides zeae]MDT9593448.1 type VII secretion protein EccB [Nocardioides zeae]
MATKRDLVEAYSFSRRRLVTAFVSGAPGGREVEPSRPGRALAGGIALTVLVLAAGAVLGFLKPRPDAGWADRGGFVVAEGTVQLYLVQNDEGDDDPVLIPVVNTVSARLIVGEDLDPVTVPQSEIDRYEVIEGIGIPNAPVTTPSDSALVEDGWTSCTAPGAGVRTAVTSTPQVDLVTEQSAFVRSGESYYVVTPGQPAAATGEVRYFRMKLPSDPEDLNRVLTNLRGPGLEDVVEVPSRWLDMLPAGPALNAAAFDFGGASFSGQVPGLTDAEGQPLAAGTLVTYQGEDAVVGSDGYWPLSEFASAVYAALPGRAAPVEVDELPGTRGSNPYPDDVWPGAVPAALGGGVTADLCAVLQTHADEPPTVVLGVRPTPEVAAGDLAPDTHVGYVERARGSVVRVGGFTATAAEDAFLIDPQGIRYALPGDSLQRLGYGRDQARVVPTAWVETFSCGVTLTRDEALKTLSAERQAQQSCGSAEADATEATDGTDGAGEGSG